MMKCLALDVGSSSIKGNVLNLSDCSIESTMSVAFPSPVPGLPAGHFEVSLTLIEQQVRNVLFGLMETAPDVVSVFFSGQMGGTVLVDADGQPLTNFLSWRDQRTSKQDADGRSLLDEIRHRWHGDVMQSLGNELQPGSAASLMFWLAAHNKLPDGALPVSIADYVISRLCGVPASMHVTQAIGMLNLHTRTWHEEAFALLGLRSSRSHELTDRIEAVGQVSLNGRTLDVFGAYGDQQCALRGAGLQEGELSLNISTGSQVSQRTAAFRPGTCQTRCYFDAGCLNTITHLPAGRSLNVFVDLLTELAVAEGVTLNNVWDNIIRKTAETTEPELNVDLAFFAGPLGTSGRIEQITTENLSVGSLFHAAFRNMADNYHKCAQWLDPEQSWTSIVVSGGLTQSVPLLRQMIEHRFGTELRTSAGDEAMLGLLDIAKEVHKVK